MKRQFTIMLGAVAMAALAVTTPAQTLLYNWNFDNATGSGATLNYAPSSLGAGQTGGNLGLTSGSTAVYNSGSGVSGAPGDLGLVNTGTYGANNNGNSGIFGAGLGGFGGSLSQVTLTMWFNPSVASENTARLLDINYANTNADGNAIYLGFANGNRLQFKVNGTDAGIATTTTFSANTWYYIAISYDAAVGTSVYLGTTTTAATLYGSSLVTAGGAVPFSSTTNFISVLNQLTFGGVRSADGTMDNLSIYSGAGSQAFVQGVQGVPEPSAAVMFGFGGLALLATFRRRRH